MSLCLEISQQPITSLTDLISNTGGILGLFLGMSFLSLIEFVEAIIEIFWIVLFPNSSPIANSSTKLEKF